MSSTTLSLEMPANRKSTAKYLPAGRVTCTLKHQRSLSLLELRQRISPLQHHFRDDHAAVYLPGFTSVAFHY